MGRKAKYSKEERIRHVKIISVVRRALVALQVVSAQLMKLSADGT